MKTCLCMCQLLEARELGLKYHQQFVQYLKICLNSQNLIIFLKYTYNLRGSAGTSRNLSNPKPLKNTASEHCHPHRRWTWAHHPPSLYEIVLSYHRDLSVDLGCSHGNVTRILAESSSQVLGADPSDGMIRQAESLASENGHQNIASLVSSTEALPFLEDEAWIL